jgi:hypothetical protein
MADQFLRVYDYDDAPTIRAFNEDKRFFRCIMGPYGCLSSDTEYLTQSGWKYFNEYNGTDLIAEFNPETSGMEFRKPNEYIKLPCDSFLHLKNLYGIDQLLSDEHTVLFNTRFKPEEWRTISALDLATSHNKLKDGWSGRIPTTFRAPQTSGVDLDDFELRLMVAISADGHFPKNQDPPPCMVCVRKQRKKDRMRWLLSECNIDWKERNYAARPTETTFVFKAPEQNKLLWKYIDATEEQLAIIADEFTYWDGHEDCYGGRVYASVIKENADFIQYALATVGVRSTISLIEHDNEKWKDGYRLYAGTGATLLSMRQAPKIERVPSLDGFKYCFTTSTGFFVARRNGRIFITGNSGKSSGCVAEIIDVGVNQAPDQTKTRKTRWAVIRSSYRMLLDTTMETFFQWLPPEYFGTFSVTNYIYTIDKIVLDDGTKVEIEIIFRALDRPEHVRNLLSLELTGAWFNEVKETPKIIVDNMEGRVNRYPSVMDGGATWSGIIADTNPPDTDSWLYRLFEEQVPKDPILQSKYVLFKQPPGRSKEAENRKYLADDYYTNMAIGKDPEFIKVYIDGDYGYIRDGKPVFSNYSDTMHCSEEILLPTKGVPVIISLDFGLSPAAVFSQYMPKGQFNVFNEFTSEDMGIRRFFTDVIKPYIFANLRGYEIIVTGDPAGVRRQDTDERSCFDELRLMGFPATPAHSNSFLARYNAVDNFLTKNVEGKPAFQLSPNCAMLRKGFIGEYKLKKYQGMNEKFSEVPVKNSFSHVHDALQYGVMVVDRAANIEKTRTPSQLRYASKYAAARPQMSAWT